MKRILTMVLAVFLATPAFAASDEDAFKFYQANRGSHCTPDGALLGSDTLESRLEGDQGSDEKPGRYTIKYKEYDEAKTISLWQFSCYAAAYNFGSAFVIQRDDGPLKMLQLAMPHFSSEIFDVEGRSLSKFKHIGFVSTHVVSNGGFVSTDNSIVHFHKHRGIGDQYETATWSFVDGQFVLTNFEMEPNGQSLPESYGPTSVDDDGERQPLVKMEFGTQYTPKEQKE